MNATNPLLLPELLKSILDELSFPNLASALRVCYLWFDIGTDKLWREPSVSALASVDPRRRGFYTKKVLELEFGYLEEIHHEAFKKFEFPQLRKLSEVYYNVLPSPPPLDQYIQPKLHEFASSLGPITEQFYDRLFSNCPRLQLLSIGTPAEDFSSDQFFTSMQKCKSLKTLHFTRDMERHVTCEPLLQIAGRSNLESLTLDWVLEHEVVETIFDASPELFKGLTTLDVKVESRDVSTIIRGIKSVRSLNMTIIDDDVNVLCHIATLNELQSLAVTHSRGTMYSLTELQSLQALSKLQQLRIGPPIRHYFEDVGAGLTDESFGSFIAHFPQLREFCMLISCDLSVSALRSLAKSCPMIKSIHLFGSYDIQSLESIPGPIFPHLTSLEIGAVVEGLGSG